MGIPHSLKYRSPLTGNQRFKPKHANTHTHTNTTTKLSYTKYEDNNSNERERKPNLTEIISAEENKTTIDGYGYHLGVIGDRIRESANVMIVFSLCAENTKERMSNIVVALPITCVCSFGNWNVHLHILIHRHMWLMVSCVYLIPRQGKRLREQNTNYGMVVH